MVSVSEDGVGWRISAGPQGVDVLAAQLPVKDLADMLESLEVTMKYYKSDDDPNKTHYVTEKTLYDWNAKCHDGVDFENCISTNRREKMEVDHTFEFCIDYCFEATPAPFLSTPPPKGAKITPAPTHSPTPYPTTLPVTLEPTPQPTEFKPTAYPTAHPTANPTPPPSCKTCPTPEPTPPTPAPTLLPTSFPTAVPTPIPTPMPTVKLTPGPTLMPTPHPTVKP